MANKRKNIFLIIILNFLLLPLFSSYICAETKLAEHSENSFKLTLKQTSADSEDLLLNISAPKSAGSSVFSLKDPNRIVIDLGAIKIKKNIQLNVDNRTIEAIRLGSHVDKTRIVIDIKSQDLPTYSWSETPGEATLKLSVGSKVTVSVDKQDKSNDKASENKPVTTRLPEKIASPIASLAKEEDDLLIEEILELSKRPKGNMTATPVPTQTSIPEATLATAEPTTEPTKVPTIAASPTHSPSPVATAQATAHPTEKPLVNVVENPNQQILKEITFGYSDDAEAKPVIKLSMNKKPEFQLTKEGEKNYSLVVDDCKLAKEELLLPQFPPHDFIGFTIVKAEKYDKAARITIGTEHGIRISAAPKDNEIWIRILSGKNS